LVWFLHGDSPFLGKRKFALAYQGLSGESLLSTIYRAFPDLLDEVFNVYGQYSAWKLRNMTHAEPPWIEAHNVSPSTVISHASMKSYFKTLING